MEAVTTWIEEWCNLYPSDVEFNGNKLKSPVKYCVTKMQKFCKDNPLFTKDIIFAATKRYLEEQQARRWEYTKQSTYFISKLGQPSVLEQYCNKILEGNVKPVVQALPEYDPMSDFI